MWNIPSGQIKPLRCINTYIHIYIYIHIERYIYIHTYAKLNCSVWLDPLTCPAAVGIHGIRCYPSYPHPCTPNLEIEVVHVFDLAAQPSSMSPCHCRSARRLVCLQFACKGSISTPNMFENWRRWSQGHKHRFDQSVCLRMKNSKQARCTILLRHDLQL